MSPRARVGVVVGAVAVAAAAAAVGGALVQGREAGGEAHAPAATEPLAEERPALQLALLDRDGQEARALRAAEAAWNDGNDAEARRRFAALRERNPESLEAAVGAAIAGGREHALAELGRLVQEHPESGVVRLNLGLALLATGDLESAREEWEEVKRRDPDSPAALRADDLLHPRSPPGRPQLILADVPQDVAELRVERRLAVLANRAEGGGARAWVVYASALEQAGRRLSAQRAYDRAVELDPGNLEARVGSALSRFDKDDPSQAFSRLGPLASQHPRAAIVRFHLGLALLWLPSLEEAREQLERAHRDDPDGFYGRQAARVLDRLGAVD